MNQSANTPPKVLFTLPALTAGGAERVLITLMNNIDRTKFSPEFLTVSDTGPLRDLIDPAIPFHSLHGGKVSRAIPRLYKALKQTRPDIVVATMAHMNMCLMVLKPFFPQTRFIIREAITPSFLLDEKKSVAPFLRLAYRVLYPKAEKVVSPAQAIIDEFGSLLGMSCDNHVLLYNPVDMDRIREKERKAFDIPKDRSNTIQFVSAGRLHDQKGFDRVIERLGDFKPPYNWHWMIWGEGAAREKLERMIAEAGLQDRVTLAGLSTHPWPHYAAADCFLMPSRWEGLPNVVLESLACGTPVIATKESGGIAEIAARAAGSVTVADDMGAFMNAMAQVTPETVRHFRTSLLPDEFSKDHVINRFESILAAEI